jgi:hypothetical protein
VISAGVWLNRYFPVAPSRPLKMIGLPAMSSPRAAFVIAYTHAQSRQRG